MAVDEQKFNGISPGRTTTMSTNQEIFLGKFDLSFSTTLAPRSARFDRDARPRKFASAARVTRGQKARHIIVRLISDLSPAHPPTVPRSPASSSCTHCGFPGGLPHDGAARRASAGLGMVGCIRSLHIDGVALVLRDSAIDGQSIRECLE